MASDTTDDPVGYFVQDMRQHGRTERTVDAYERVLSSYRTYLSEEFETTPEDANYRNCVAWVNTLRQTHSQSTVASYASYLNRFYTYMSQVGVFDTNPMALVIEEMDESIDTNPTRRDLSLEAMREFVEDVTHPLHRTVIVTLLKTGMRAGELSNLDMRDLSLRSNPSTARPQLTEKGDSLFVAADRSIGKNAEGECRPASNKRKRATIVPVDEELRRVLHRWLLVRPETASPANPLFVHTARNWGERLSPDAIHHLVETHARKQGWYREGGGAEENVTPHYFRHFFTTYLRDRTGDRGVVKYLRGDVASDVIDTYTHNWGDRVRDGYESNIYSLL